MKNLNAGALLVLLLALALSGCGRQVVEFADGGPNTPDAGPLPLAPTITSTLPTNGATDVPVTTQVRAVFSEAMDPTTLDPSTFLVKEGTTSVSGAVSYDEPTHTATFTPASPLSVSTVYSATVTTGAMDPGGRALAGDVSWSFTTAADTLPPTVTSTTPLDQATNVSVNKKPTVTFSKAMDPATINAQTFTLKQGATLVSGSVALDGATNTATFTPVSPLGVGLVYTAEVTTGAKDSAGVALAQRYTWSFTTSACSLSPVVLGSAGNFAVLAGSTVTNTGPTSVTGDLGVSPGNAITGFPPGSVSGTQYPGGPIAAQGIADLTTAFNDAAGRTQCPITVAGDLGGQTLAPGLYKSTSSLSVTTADLTLDAQGDPDAVFIFQIASTLDTAGGRQVILAGGAKAANIFWQVGSSATLGTTSAFQGTIMADQAVTLKTGATLDGRALARIAATSLDSNTIVLPSP